MDWVVLHYQAIRYKLLQVLFLFTKRNIILKMIYIMLMFAIFECIYKMNFSLLEHNLENVGNRRHGVDCDSAEGYSESLCLSKVRSLDTATTAESTASLNSHLQDVANDTATTPEEQRKPLTDLNITFVLEDIKIGGSPFPPTNPHPYKLMSSPSACGFNGSRSNVLILMSSRPGNYYQRKIIRRAWEELKDQRTRLVFLLGFLEDDQYVIEEESDRYGDILQEDFLDSYKNDIVKFIMGYNWAIKQCPGADVILSVNETLQVKSNILLEYIWDLVIGKQASIFRGNILPATKHKELAILDKTVVTKSTYANVNLASRDVADKFKMIFPYIGNSDNDLNAYLGNLSNILSIKYDYDPYLDPGNPLSFFASAGENLSRQLLSYPLNINFKRLVRRKILYGEEIPQESVNRKLLPLVHNATQCHFTRKGNTSGQILVVVWSDPSDTEQRSAIREMWKYTDPGTVRKVFVLGSVDVHQDDIDAENKYHGDIIQVAGSNDKFYDTIKTVSAFAWIVKNCKSANSVIFLDGNINVNMNMITAFMGTLIGIKNNEKLFLGHVVDKRKPDRRKGSPLYVSEDDYPFDQVPPYVIGSNYVMSFNIVKSFHVVFPFVKYCPNVDLYLGIVASKLMITPKHDPHLDRRNQASFLRDNP